MSSHPFRSPIRDHSVRFCRMKTSDTSCAIPTLLSQSTKKQKRLTKTDRPPRYDRRHAKSRAQNGGCMMSPAHPVFRVYRIIRLQVPRPIIDVQAVRVGSPGPEEVFVPGDAGCLHVRPREIIPVGDGDAAAGGCSGWCTWSARVEGFGREAVVIVSSARSRFARANGVRWFLVALREAGGKKRSGYHSSEERACRRSNISLGCTAIIALHTKQEGPLLYPRPSPSATTMGAQPSHAVRVVDETHATKRSVGPTDAPDVSHAVESASEELEVAVEKMRARVRRLGCG